MKSKDENVPRSEQTAPAPAETPEVPFPIVVVGASGGGLESFQTFLDRVPPESGLCFILAQHQDSRFETLSPEVLARHTRMPVVHVQEGLKLQPNHVYLATRNAYVGVDGRKFQIAENKGAPVHLPIDYLFRSLAEDQAEWVIGIILSGTENDGALGLRAIKEHGGVTVAQTPQTASHDHMPRHAISSGYIDFVLELEEMPERVLEYVKNLKALLQRRGAESIQEKAPRLLKKVLFFLRKHTGHDFTQYKHSTLLRRLQRRMQLLYLDSIEKYLELLKNGPQEAEALLKDLLIGVTQFFRDPDAFERLEQKIIPELFRDKKPDDQVRVWVPGCATGEEAYSIAILLAEFAGKMEQPPKLQIFATDLDAEAVEFARKGVYSEHIARDLRPERMNRFFKRCAAGCEVNEEIRKMCLFSTHNLINDPPFSRLDLISCRNLLIYMELELQKRVLRIMHYCLKPCGFLFLGPSENLASRSELFRPLDKKYRLYQRKPGDLHSVLPLPDGGRSMKSRTPLPLVIAPKEGNQLRIIERLILEEYACPCVIVNDRGEVLYFAGPTGRYLQPQAGAPSNRLINMARGNLRAELRTALYRALTSRQQVVRENLSLQAGRSVRHHFTLIVRPLTELPKDFDLYIVVFQEVARVGGPPAPALDVSEAAHPVVRQLEEELRTTKEDLQTTIEEVETSNEELKSANEELLSMNEELQSTNEELQTSKEEVQAANEELQVKNSELDSAHADLQNFFQSTGVATMFVDTHLRIKRFTPALAETFGIGERDVGRPFAEVLAELAAQSDLQTKAQEVMRSKVPYERAFAHEEGGKWSIMRITPYQGVDRAVQGAVITFIDITDIKAVERSHSQIAAIVESSDDAIISKNLNGIITSWNKGAWQLFGYTAEEAIGKAILMLIPPGYSDEENAILEKIQQGQRVDRYETVRRRKDGKLVNCSVTVSAIKDGEGKVIGASKIARDITDQKKAEKILAEAKDALAATNQDLERRVQLRTGELAETNSQLEALVYSIAHDLRAPLRAMQGFSRMLLDDCGPTLDETARDYAQRIARSAESMDKLVFDLLNYGRVARAELNLADTNVESAWAAAMAQNEQAVAEKKARVEITGPFPHVLAHETTLVQVLANLLSNGLKFVPPGMTPEIRFYAETRGNRVRLWIADKGIGIAPEYHDRIFRVFERLHGASYAGTGVGLAIVRKGVERMGGEVGLESTPGTGSRFWVDLPKAPLPVTAG